jgi:hypothetical protein
LAPASAEYLPAKQLVHAEDPGDNEYDPRQLMHVEKPIPEYFPLAQVAHIADELAPIADEYVPAEQAVQFVDPVVFAYVPAPQEVGVVVPGAGHMVPTGQREHDVTPPEENCPMGHAVQDVAPIFAKYPLPQ